MQPGGAPVPHGYPWLLLDRVVTLEPGISAVALRPLTSGDPLLAGSGQVPAVLLAEALAQCAGVAVLGARAGGHAVVARIDRFRSRMGVRAGTQMSVAVRIVRIFGRTAKVRGLVRVDGRVFAAGEVVLQLDGASATTQGGDV